MAAVVAGPELSLESLELEGDFAVGVAEELLRRKANLQYESGCEIRNAVLPVFS